MLKKLKLLNKLSLSIMAEGDNISIVKIATEEAVKIFQAEFGFAWGKFRVNDLYKLVYKTRHTPYTPIFPFERKNSNNEVLFDCNVERKNYKSNISSYIKSYLIIPVHYFDHAYGSVVLCYKNKRDFTEEEFALTKTAGNIIAHAITINWLVENEQKALALAEKQKATEVLLSEEKRRNEFIANATHEIRTPLAIIKGNIDLALGDKKQSNFCRHVFLAIDEEVRRLSDMVSDLALLTSRGSRGQTDVIAYGKVNVYSLIDSIIKRCKTLAIEKNISIETKNIPKITISGNKPYLEKMFMNLVRNSIIYGKENGSTLVSAKVSKSQLQINVQDDGIGVSKEDIAHIFERFYRGDKSHHSDGNRTGLGLAIVKWVAEIHGGRVEVKSAPNKGSIFSVKLPIKRS